MMQWERVFWAVLTGVALATAGCGAPTLYGVPPPGDSNTDAEEEPSDDAEEDEMPAGAYGPPPDM